MLKTLLIRLYLLFLERRPVKGLAIGGKTILKSGFKTGVKTFLGTEALETVARQGGVGVGNEVDEIAELASMNQIDYSRGMNVNVDVQMSDDSRTTSKTTSQQILVDTTTQGTPLSTTYTDDVFVRNRE